MLELVNEFKRVSGCSAFSDLPGCHGMNDTISCSYSKMIKLFEIEDSEDWEIIFKVHSPAFVRFLIEKIDSLQKQINDEKKN